MSTPCVPWESWAPPLDPPTPGGLPADQAECIADQWWMADPHLCAALMWEAYAATLPASAPVSQVATGAQSVTYNPPMPGGDYGAAMARAAWHRSFADAEAVSVPLHLAAPGMAGRCGGGGWNWWPVTPEPEPEP